MRRQNVRGAADRESGMSHREIPLRVSSAAEREMFQ